MPICPGCERTIPYELLDIHERNCAGIWNATFGLQATDVSIDVRATERLEQRVAALEKRLDEVENGAEGERDRRERFVTTRQGRQSPGRE